MHFDYIKGERRLVPDNEKDVNRAFIVLSTFSKNRLLNAAIFVPGMALPKETSDFVAGGIWKMAVDAAVYHGLPKPHPLNLEATQDHLDYSVELSDLMIDNITSNVD